MAGRAEASSADVSRRMSRQARTGTAPEVSLRRELHRRGRRFRVDFGLRTVGLARRRADIVFTRRKVAVFVDGCFWHSCPVHATQPRANREWWVAKLAGNVDRDRDTDERLRSAGWRVVRFWEHDDPIQAADVLEQVLEEQEATGCASGTRG